MEAIHIEKLTKYYGKYRGVEEISLNVEKGDIFGFLGPNGSGKSTTIRSLLGLIHFQSGNAKVLGMDVKKDNIKILQNVGYMPSEAMFYPSLTVAEVIRLAADSRGMDCREEAKILCERLQVDTKKKIEELSLGNRKKISIVCAMQHKPELFIFDEPTSGLDPLMQTEFFKLVEEYNKQGATCFLSSHVLSEVRKYCNKAAIVKNGKIVCVDTIENLAHTKERKVKISGIEEFFIPNAVEFHKTEEGFEFVYTGSSKDLIQLLQDKPITNLLIEELSLDEIFMHYYGEE